MNRERTVHFLTPSYAPAGGVVKVMDYVSHAVAFGLRATVYSANALPSDSDPLFAMNRLAFLLDHDNVAFKRGYDVHMDSDDFMFVSYPTHYDIATRALLRGMSPARIIHILQGTRNANPEWLAGRAVRTLSRPASRISINGIVAGTIAPYLDGRGLHRTIVAGHDLDFFRQVRSASTREQLRVGYTTWKSDVGDRVKDLLRGNDTFEFRAIREAATWEELRELYAWSDVFLNTPLAEEGLYLPGLEAMSNGAIVVTPDSGGNMAYCDPGENCLLVDFDDAHGYASALQEVVEMDEGKRSSFRHAGLRACGPFDLGEERRNFELFLNEASELAECQEGM